MSPRTIRFITITFLGAVALKIIAPWWDPILPVLFLWAGYANGWVDRGD